MIRVIWVCSVHRLEYMSLHGPVRWSSTGWLCAGSSWLLTAPLIAPVTDIIYLTFSDEHLTQKTKLCIMPPSTCHEDDRKLTIMLLLSVCLTVWRCGSVSLSTVFPLHHQLLSRGGNEQLRCFILPVLLCLIFCCLVFVWFVWAHTCSCLFSSCEASWPWCWPLGIELSAGFSFGFMCVYKREYCDVCAFTTSVHIWMGRNLSHASSSSLSSMLSLCNDVSNKGKRKPMCVRLINTSTVGYFSVDVWISFGAFSQPKASKMIFLL